MIGTSGPSTSMMALSTPMPRSAASTCSAVETSGPFAVAQHGREFGCDHGVGGGLNFAVGTLETGADKNKTRIDGRRSKGKSDG